MGRYEYNDSLVKQAITELNNAMAAISDVTTEIRNGINTITNATGANCISYNYDKLLELQTTAEEIIEEDIKTIQKKVTAIEEYEKSGLFTQFFASAGMAITKFAEGVATAFEDLGDGFVSTAGFIGGIFSSDFKNACGEYVKKEHVGEWFAKGYEGDGFLGSINKYSWFSHTSTAANIFKGIGTAAPYIALSMTGVGIVTETAAAGISGIGQGTESGLQAGKTFNSAFAGGVWQGAKNAALVYTMNKLAQKAQAGKTTTTVVDDISTQIDDISREAADDFATLTDKNITSTASKTNAIADDAYNAAVKRQLKLDDSMNIAVRKAKGTTAKDDYLTIFQVADDGVQTPIGYIRQNSNGHLVLTSKKAGAQTTRVIGETGINGTINSYTTLGNMDDVISNGQITLSGGPVTTTTKVTKTTTTPANNIFTKARAKADKTGLTKALDKSDDFLKTNKVTTTTSKIVNKVPGVSKVKGAVGKAATAIKGSKIGQAVTKAVNAHPQAAYAAAAGVFTADQIGQTARGTDYIVSQAELPEPKPEIIIDPNLTPPPTSVPIITDIPTTTPPVTTPPVTTPPDNGPTITSPPNSGFPNGNSSSNSGGGGYSGGGYTGENTGSTPQIGDATGLENESLSGSFSELIGGNEYTNIPTSSSPITTTTTTSGKKSIIPIIAGLGAATVAGIGTKAYLDKKENDGNTAEDFETEEWEEDSLAIDYNDDVEEENDYLNPSDEYAYQEEDEEPAGNYQAANSSELASM